MCSTSVNSRKRSRSPGLDYLEEGSEDEQALRDAREVFRNLILRPRMLVDTHKIDTSLELFGRKIDYPILIDPAGGKNCFFRNGEQEVAKAARNAKALHITNGGIEDLVESGKGPATWWQVTTGGGLMNRQTRKAFRQPVGRSGMRRHLLHGGHLACLATRTVHAQ